MGKGASFVYSLNGVNRGGVDSGNTGDGTAKGTGTLEDPYNPAGAAAAVANLTWTDKDNYDKTEPVYIKGKIVSGRPAIPRSRRTTLLSCMVLL